MKYFHVCTHCGRKWRKIEIIYDLPDSANLSFFSESTQVHGIGKVCVLTFFINSRGPSVVWVSLFFIIILWYWLPFSRVYLRMVCTPIEKVSLTGNSDLTSLLFRWGVTSSLLSIEVCLPEKLSFKSSLRDSVSSKSYENQNKTTLRENAEYLRVYN